MTRPAADTLGVGMQTEPGEPRVLMGHLVSLGRFLAGLLLCLTPLTAILVLGTLMRGLASRPQSGITANRVRSRYSSSASNNQGLE
jgi:hypothetical protein